MPYWVRILVSIAIRLGIPWLLKAFPGIPASVVEEIRKLIEELTQSKKQARLQRKKRIREVKAKLCT